MLTRPSKHLFLISICLCFFSSSFSQADKNVIGIWKGTSICQVKNSPCHDEIVVYHISSAKTPGNYIINANKIVNGAEEEMGALTATYDTAKHLLTAHFRENDLWEFKLTGDQMDGTLINNKVLYRIVKLKKEN